MGPWRRYRRIGPKRMTISGITDILVLPNMDILPGTLKDGR